MGNQLDKVREREHDYLSPEDQKKQKDKAKYRHHRAKEREEERIERERVERLERERRERDRIEQDRIAREQDRISRERALEADRGKLENEKRELEEKQRLQAAAVAPAPPIVTPPLTNLQPRDVVYDGSVRREGFTREPVIHEKIITTEMHEPIYERAYRPTIVQERTATVYPEPPRFTAGQQSASYETSRYATPVWHELGYPESWSRPAFEYFENQRIENQRMQRDMSYQGQRKYYEEPLQQQGGQRKFYEEPLQQQGGHHKFYEEHHGQRKFYEDQRDFDGGKRNVIEREPIVHETVKRTVREEIQPVIYREVVEPHVIRKTIPIYEKVEGKEIIEETKGPDQIRTFNEQSYLNREVTGH